MSGANLQPNAEINLCAGHAIGARRLLRSDFDGRNVGQPFQADYSTAVRLESLTYGGWRRVVTTVMLALILGAKLY
jgi:hypothetical protein